jgi:hypothetical protein
MTQYQTLEEIEKTKRIYQTLSEPVFPSIIVLLITTHGTVNLDKNEEVLTFTVPEGITIFRSLASTVGECNIINEDMVDKYIEIIKSNMENLTNESTILDSVNEVTSAIRDIDIGELPEREKEIKNFRKKKLSEKAAEDSLRVYEGYYYGIDKSHNVTVKNPDEQMLNKIYSRVDSEVTLNDWVIKAINLPGEPDILKYLFRPRRGKLAESSITLENIVDFFKSKGVEQLIIFDVSCSNIRDTEQSDISSRAARRIRRTDVTNLGGENLKRRKTKRRKTKRRKTKRRMSRK